nr:MAG TPA: hypothetical protein [Caudoviricetes sp.]
METEPNFQIICYTISTSFEVFFYLTNCTRFFRVFFSAIKKSLVRKA